MDYKVENKESTKFSCFIILFGGIFSFVLLILFFSFLEEFIQGDIPFWILLIPVGSLGFVLLVLSCFPLYSTISIEYLKNDPSIKRVKIRKFNILICFNKNYIYDLKEIKEFYTRVSNGVSYTVNGTHYDAYDIVLVLNDGSEVVVLKGEMDDGSRSNFEFLLKAYIPRRQDNYNSNYYLNVKNYNNFNRISNNFYKTQNGSLYNNGSGSPEELHEIQPSFKESETLGHDPSNIKALEDSNQNVDAPPVQ